MLGVRARRSSAVAGDEVSDIEPLLGRECAAHWVLTDGGQGDLLKDGG